MSTITTATPRVGTLARSTSSTQQLARTQALLDRATARVSTGLKFSKPSEAPGDAAMAARLRRTLELREGFASNMRDAEHILTRTDTTLGEAVDLLREARSLALGSIGTSATDAERLGAADTLRAMETRLLALANARVGNVAVFGGGKGAGDPFVAAPAGVKYVGEEATLEAAVGDGGARLDLLVNAGDVFGGVSERVGDATLTPAVTPGTPLDDLFAGDGLPRGSLRISNAGSAAIVDLGDADTIDDVLARINASGIGVTATASSTGIDLAGASVLVEDAGGGVAQALGLTRPAPAASIAGGDLSPAITVHTPLADLNGGAGIDLTGGLVLDDGETTETVSLAGITTVGELFHRLQDAAIDVSPAISEDGSTLLLRNAVQGAKLRVGEGTGTSAADLGWETFTASDPLSELNGGRGVRLDPAGPDLRVVDSANVGFSVDLDGAATVQDAINAINVAAAAAGSALAAAFDASVPGLVLSNATAVTSAGESNAALDLGISGAAVAGTITGEDVNPITSEGVFGHMRALVAALERNDTAAATSAIADLEADEAKAIDARGEVGGRLQELELRQGVLADQTLATRELLSRIEEVDFAEAVVEYQTLQSSLQAQMQTTSQMLNLSLFDYLR